MSLNRGICLLGLPLLLFCAGAGVAAVGIEAVQSIAPEPANLLEAVAQGHNDEIFNRVSAGEDPGRSAVVAHAMFHWRPRDTTSPLLVAIAGGDINKVAYMVNHTALMASPPNDLALCVVARYGHSNIAQLLMKRGALPVPKDRCGEEATPEDVARRYENFGLGETLRDYRLSKEQGASTEDSGARVDAGAGEATPASHRDAAPSP